MPRIILRYRPTTAFLAVYATLALPGAAIGLALAVMVPTTGAALTLVAGLAAFLIAVTRAASGQGIGPFRFIGGIGVPRVLALRRHRLRHAAAFAVVSASGQACVIAALSVIAPGVAAWPGPGMVAALLGIHALLALAAIHAAACTIGALRRAFAMARPGV